MQPGGARSGTAKKNSDLIGDCAALIAALIQKMDYDGPHITGSGYHQALQYARYGNAALAAFETAPSIGLAVLAERIGSVLIITGDLSRGLSLFERYRVIARLLLAEAPDNPDLKNNLAISWIKLGWFYVGSRQDREQAIVFYTQAKSLLTELVRDYPAYAEFSRNLNWVNQQLPDT